LKGKIQTLPSFFCGLFKSTLRGLDMEIQKSAVSERRRLEKDPNSHAKGNLFSESI